MLRLLGITHTPQGEAIRRIPRAIKVSIGHRAGKAIHAFIDAENRWKVEVGVGREAKVQTFGAREEAERFYRDAWKTAPMRDYPQKLPYMTFCRVAADGESLVADFDAIEAHGPVPTEIPIMFTDPDPAEGAYQYWQTRGLGCSGDGVVARCKTELVSVDPAAAAEAKKNGLEWYQPSRCWLTGCPEKGGRNCKPHARLAFQLVRQPKIGQKAELATTSPRSIAQLFSAIEEMRGLVMRLKPDAEIVGIPLILAIRAWKHSTPNGQTGKSYAFSLEFRANDIGSLRRELEGHVRNWSYQIAGTAAPAAPPQLAPAAEDDVVNAALDEDGDDEVAGAAMVAEFHPAADQPAEPGDDEMTPEPVRETPATSKLRSRLREAKGTKTEPVVAEAKPVETAVEAEPQSATQPEPAQVKTTEAPSKKSLF